MEIETLKRMIGVMDVLIVKGKAYISNRFYNTFLIYDLQEETIEKAERFMQMDASSFAYHGGCIEYKGTVYFYPDNGYGVHAYHVDNGSQKYYDLGFCQVGYSCIFRDKLILFPWYARQGLITIDLKEETIDVQHDWWDVERILGDVSSNFLYTGMYDDHKVWSHCTKSNFLLISDFQMHSLKKYTIEVEEKALYGSAYDGEDFWFTVVGKDLLYQWNIEGGIQNCYKPGFKLDEYDMPPCRKLVCAKGYVFIISCHENALFLLNKGTGKMEVLSQFPPDTIYPKAKYWGVKERIYGDKLYLFCDVTDLIIQVDLNSLEVRYMKTQVIGSQVFEEYKNQIWKEILLEIEDKNYRCENGYDWKTYISTFIQLDKEMYGEDVETLQAGKIGGNIYRKVGTK